MRHITIPADITVTVVDQFGAETMPNVQFVPALICGAWTTDRVYGESVDTLLEAIDIQQAFRGKRPGDVVAITEAAYSRLLRVVKAPTGGYSSPALMLQLMPMIEAVLMATTEAPKDSVVTEERAS